MSNLSASNEIVNSKENIFIKSSNEMYLGNSSNGQTNKAAEVLYVKSTRSVGREDSHCFINDIETEGGFSHRLDKYKDWKTLKNTTNTQHKVKKSEGSIKSGDRINFASEEKDHISFERVSEIKVDKVDKINSSPSVVYSKKEHSIENNSSKKDSDKLVDKKTTLKSKLATPVDPKKVLKKQLEKKNSYSEKIKKENSSRIEEKKNSSKELKENLGDIDGKKGKTDRKHYSEGGPQAFGLSNGFHARTKSASDNPNNMYNNNQRYHNVEESNKLGYSSKSSEKVKNSNTVREEHPILDEKQKRERQFAYEQYLKQSFPVTQRPKTEGKQSGIVVQKNNFFIPTLIKDKTVEIKKRSVSDKEVPDLSESTILSNRKKLLEDFELNLLKTREKEKNKESSQNNDKISKKLKCLNEKGRLEKILNENDMELANEEENYENDKFEEEKGDKSKNYDSNSNQDQELSEGQSNPGLHLRNESSSYPNSNSRTKQLVHNRNYSDGSTYTNRLKTSEKSIPQQAKKPKIDSFDFIKKIGKNVINEDEIAEMGNELENSFRKSFNIKIQKINHPEQRRKKSYDEVINNNKQIKVDNRTYQVYDEENNFVFSYRQKSSNTDRNELKNYIKESKKKIKEEKIKVEQEATERNLKIYLNLMNLHEKTLPKKTSSSADKDNSGNSLNIVSKRGKKLIRNDSYQGTKRDKFANKNDDSSIIDEEVYFKEMCDFTKKVLPQAIPKKRRVQSTDAWLRKQSNVINNDDGAEVEKSNEMNNYNNSPNNKYNNYTNNVNNANNKNINQSPVNPVSHDELVSLMETQKHNLRSVDSNDLISEKSPLSNRENFKNTAKTGMSGKTSSEYDRQSVNSKNNYSPNKVEKIEESPQKGKNDIKVKEVQNDNNPYKNNNKIDKTVNFNDAKNEVLNKKDIKNNLNQNSQKKEDIEEVNAYKKNNDKANKIKEQEKQQQLLKEEEEKHQKQQQLLKEQEKHQKQQQLLKEQERQQQLIKEQEKHKIKDEAIKNQIKKENKSVNELKNSQNSMNSMNSMNKSEKDGRISKTSKQESPAKSQLSKQGSEYNNEYYNDGDRYNESPLSKQRDNNNKISTDPRNNNAVSVNNSMNDQSYNPSPIKSNKHSNYQGDQEEVFIENEEEEKEIQEYCAMVIQEFIRRNYMLRHQDDNQEQYPGEYTGEQFNEEDVNDENKDNNQNNYYNNENNEYNSYNNHNDNQYYNNKSVEKSIEKSPESKKKPQVTPGSRDYLSDGSNTIDRVERVDQHSNISAKTNDKVDKKDKVESNKHFIGDFSNRSGEPLKYLDEMRSSNDHENDNENDNNNEYYEEEYDHFNDTPNSAKNNQSNNNNSNNKHSQHYNNKASPQSVSKHSPHHNHYDNEYDNSFNSEAISASIHKTRNSMLNDSPLHLHPKDMNTSQGSLFKKERLQLKKSNSLKSHKTENSQELGNEDLMPQNSKISINSEGNDALEKLKRSFNSGRVAYSAMAAESSGESSMIISPNTRESPKLHQLHILINQQKNALASDRSERSFELSEREQQQFKNQQKNQNNAKTNLNGPKQNSQEKIVVKKEEPITNVYNNNNSDNDKTPTDYRKKNPSNNNTNTNNKKINSPNKDEPPSPYHQNETPENKGITTNKHNIVSPPDSVNTIKSPNNQTDMLTINNRSTTVDDNRDNIISPKNPIEVKNINKISVRDNKIEEPQKSDRNVNNISEVIEVSPVRRLLDNQKKSVPALDFHNIENNENKTIIKSLDELFDKSNKNKENLISHHNSNFTNQSNDYEAGLESGIEWEDDHLYSEAKLTTEDKKLSSVFNISGFKDKDTKDVIPKEKNAEVKTVVVQEDERKFTDKSQDYDFDFDYNDANDGNDVDFDNEILDDEKDNNKFGNEDKSRNKNDRDNSDKLDAKLNIQSDVMINDNFEDISKINSARKSDTSIGERGSEILIKSPSKNDGESRRPNLPIKEVLKNLQLEEPKNTLLNFSLKNEGSGSVSNKRYDDSPKDSNKDKDNNLAINTKPTANANANITTNQTKKTSPTAKTEIKEAAPLIISEDLNKLADSITEAIIQSLLKKEISDSDRIVPKKCVLAQPSNNNPNDSMRFLKSVMDEKKENTTTIYEKEISQKLLDHVGVEIKKNYSNITTNLKKPYYNNPVMVMHGLLFRNDDVVKDNFKKVPQVKESEMINKKEVLRKFEKDNKSLRKDTLMPEVAYDKILNECVVDASRELLEKERIYGENAEPLPWSTRTRVMKYKYVDNEASKDCLVNFVKRNVNEMQKLKMGMINENHPDLEHDQLNLEREKQMMVNITKELIESEEIWKNYELEETQVKLDISEMVLEQLLNEIVEILEHVHLSRTKPDLYQHKSIYACEDIPRLSFQFEGERDMDMENLINQ